MKQEFFTWKNEQGIPEEHHISEFERVVLGREETAAEDPGIPIREAGGEDPAKTDDQKSVPDQAEAATVS